jgi:hypothetical protein
MAMIMTLDGNRRGPLGYTPIHLMDPVLLIGGIMLGAWLAGAKLKSKKKR